VFLSLFLTAGAAAAAWQEGWYGGVSGGKSSVDITAKDWDDGTLIRKNVKNEHFAYKVMAGYRFTPHFDLELSYMRFGDIKFTAVEPGTSPSLWQTGRVSGKAEAKGVSLEGVLSRPFKERYAVFAKGGILMWDTTMVSNPTLSGGTLALSPEQVLHDDGVQFIYGAGAEMRFPRQWRLRLEWEHATVRFAGTMDRGVDFPSLGVTVDF
jgi:opacity protein-like surface antigen